MANPLTRLCGICAVVSGITFIILLITSFSSLEFNDYGLDYSWITKSVSDSPYTNGIHFLGVGHHFIKYPKTVQTIEFINGKDNSNIRSRTSDGLEVTLEISFQFALKVDKLINLYRRYGEDYRKYFVLVSTHVLTETTTFFEATNFFVDRTNISTTMHDALNKQLQDCCFASVDFFQLRSVDLPKPFEESISLSEVKKQEIQRAYAESNKTSVELETKLKVADYARNITLNIADGDATAIINASVQNATAFKKVQESQSVNLGQLKKTLNLNNVDFLKFLKSRLVREFESRNLIVALKDIEEFSTK